MKKLLFLLSLWLASPALAQEQPVPMLPRMLQLHPSVAEGAAQIQREFEVETVYCLMGWVVGKTIIVEGMTPARLLTSTSTNSTFQPCGLYGVVGYYHNHPLVVEDNAGCSFSSLDVETLNAVSGFFVAILSCEEDVLVYRFKFDDKEYKTPLSGIPPIGPGGLQPASTGR